MKRLRALWAALRGRQVTFYNGRGQLIVRRVRRKPTVTFNTTSFRNYVVVKRAKPRR